MGFIGIDPHRCSNIDISEWLLEACILGAIPNFNDHYGTVGQYLTPRSMLGGRLAYSPLVL